MKKFLCFLSLLLIMTIPMAAQADSDVNQILSQYSTDDLLLVREIIDNVLASRSGESTPVSGPALKEVTVPVGTYSVGDDIPAGTYTVSYNGSLLASVEVQTSTGGNVSYNSISSGQRIGKLELKNGQIVEVGYDPVIFMPYQGLVF